MNIVITGKDGQVGWELVRSLLPLGKVIALGRNEADLSSPDTLRKVIRELNPDVIVNAAAYTAVDKAEQEEELATIINGIAPGILADEAKHCQALFVHYSTDYVFDGKKPHPYLENDIPNPLNSYGRSKLAGEIAVQNSDADYLILRTSWVYAGRGSNFLRTIMRLAKEQSELRIVCDQIGSPTWARLIADITSHVLRQSINERIDGTFNSNLYHLTSKENTSWHDFARKIIQIVQEKSENGLIVSDVSPVKTIDYPTPAKRPENSCLSTEKLEKYFGLSLPAWDEALRLCMDEI